MAFQAPAPSLGRSRGRALPLCFGSSDLYKVTAASTAPCTLGALLGCCFCISYSALHSGQNLLKSPALVSEHAVLLKACEYIHD